VGEDGQGGGVEEGGGVKVKNFNYRSPWILLSSLTLAIIIASILRAFPSRDVFWIFMGIFSAAFFLFIGLVGLVAIRRLRSSLKSDSSAQFAWQNSVEDRLDELERLKRRDMVTPEEYAAKRQEILKDL
jgi:hypothetical protein